MIHHQLCLGSVPEGFHLGKSFPTETVIFRQPSIVIVPLTTRGLSTRTVPSVPPIRYTPQVTLSNKLIEAYREREGEECVCTVHACVFVCSTGRLVFSQLAVAYCSIYSTKAMHQELYSICVKRWIGGGNLKVISADPYFSIV